MAAESFGQFDGIANYNQQLQNHSDHTASLVQSLADHVAAAASGHQGQARAVLEQHAAELAAHGNRISTQQAELSHYGQNNLGIMHGAEDDNSNAIQAAVSQLT
jgi:rubrerythrin